MNQARTQTRYLQSRRGFLLGISVVSGFASRELRAATDRQTSTLEQTFDRMLRAARLDPKMIEAIRGDREYQIVRLEAGPERAPIRTEPSARPISQGAIDLIVTFEVTGQKRYEQAYQHPVWPHGISGVTIGIGYDIGYSKDDWLREDWGNLISDGSIAVLSAACGVTGDDARELAISLRYVSIPWSRAIRQFTERTLPRYAGETEAALQNLALLNPDCFGALVSLVYNRGASFNIPERSDPSGHYAEMRNIARHMAAKDFVRIPDEIRNMKHIWADDPNMRGLLLRRDAEATLFELGLHKAA